MSVPEFQEFTKIFRLSRDMIVTEKLDGTNASVFVGEDGTVLAGSRNRWINMLDPNDHFGFSGWVTSHAEELREKLGPGQHYGEWWGMGIQRKYGLNERRFSLFNLSRWEDPEKRPACCHVVPVLLRYTFDTHKADECLAKLAEEGSAAAPGFMKPEGVVVFHAASNSLFKKTLDKNDGHKGG